jgi:hypothetical protein
MSNADKNINDPGIGDVELEHLSSCPREHLEFHLWYLKAKGWIGRLENGMLAIVWRGFHSAANAMAQLKS